MTLTEWNLERQRAWTAVFCAMASVNMDRGFGLLAETADAAIKEWEKRFPKPEV